MKAQWLECARGDGERGQWIAIYATLNPKGSLVINRFTYKRLGEPTAVMLMFDGTNNHIGIKPTARGVRNSFPVGVQGRHGGRRYTPTS